MRTKRDHYTAIIWLAFTGTLIFRIPLGHMIGDKGLAYFGVANEIYLALAGAISYGSSETVALLVRYRIRREQVKSAEKVLRIALTLGGAAGLLLGIVFGLLGDSVADKIFHIPLAGMAVGLMAPAMFFSILTGAFRGYFQGSGSKMSAIHSQIIHTVFLFVGGLIGAGLFHDYGVKVANLLQNRDYEGAYGAMGACLGLLAASVLCFIHALILFFVLKAGTKRTERENGRSQDVSFRIVSMLLATGFAYTLYWLCFQGISLIDQYLYFHVGEGASASQWGAYYGKVLVVIGIICGIAVFVCTSPIRRIVVGFEREEQRIARDRLGVLMHQCAAISIPAAIFLAVAAENILSLLFSGNQKQSASWLQAGSVTIIFFVFTSVFMEILIKGRKVKYAAGISLVALLVHIVAGTLLLRGKMGVMGVAISLDLFYGVTAVLGFLLISRLFGYTQEWIRCFAVTAVSSAIAGAVMLPLDKLFSSILGSAGSLAICLPVAILIYVLLLVVTRAFREDELEEMPGGRVFARLARNMHFL